MKRAKMVVVSSLGLGDDSAARKPKIRLTVTARSLKRIFPWLIKRLVA